MELLIKIIIKKDIYRGGITFDKILQVFRLFLPKNTKTLLFLKNFRDFDIDSLNDSFSREIKGIILDFDDFIAFEHGKILPENFEHIKKLVLKGVKFTILSNGNDLTRFENLRDFVSVVSGVRAKPSKESFEKALADLGFSKRNVIMMGDNYLTDAGCVSVGIDFVYVEPIYFSGLSFKKKIIKAPYRLFKRFFVLWAKLCNKIFFRNYI